MRDTLCETVDQVKDASRLPLSKLREDLNSECIRMIPSINVDINVKVWRRYSDIRQEIVVASRLQELA